MSSQRNDHLVNIVCRDGRDRNELCGCRRSHDQEQDDKMELVNQRSYPLEGELA